MNALQTNGYALAAFLRSLYGAVAPQAGLGAFAATAVLRYREPLQLMYPAAADSIFKGTQDLLILL